MSILIYFGINLVIVGMFLSDNRDKKSIVIFYSVLFILFGGILVLWEFTFANKVRNWFHTSDLYFYYKTYVIKKHDNLTIKQIDYIVNQLSAEKDKNTIRRLKIILKRNKQIQDKYGK